MPVAHTGASGAEISKNVATAGWGLLLIWAGAALLFHWSWGVGFLGAGVIALGAQLVRWRLRLALEPVGLVAGAALVICGVADLSSVAIDLFPVLFILAGLALLASAWPTRRRRAGVGSAAGVQAPPRG